jgi:RNA-directed DNA polymerase
LTHARVHLGADWVINFDIRNFFGSVRSGRVYAITRRCGYPEPVAKLIMGLLTQHTPEWVLRKMPTGSDPSLRSWLRSQLRSAHLPQGAPSSPAVANLACFALDRRLAGLADDLGHRYSRYADDLTLSGRGRPPGARFAGLVNKIISEAGFRPNESKQRIRTRAQRQLVTGIVVNDHPNFARAEYDRLRATLHDAVRNGPDAANRLQHDDFRSHLEGRVGWVERLNPARGARLRRQLESISWEP